MSDAERLDELRTKLRRINGHKELSAKQKQAATDLVREIVAIEGLDGLDELFPVRKSRVESNQAGAAG